MGTIGGTSAFPLVCDKLKVSIHWFLSGFICWGDGYLSDNGNGDGTGVGGGG